MTESNATCFEKWFFAYFHGDEKPLTPSVYDHLLPSLHPQYHYKKGWKTYRENGIEIVTVAAENVGVSGLHDFMVNQSVSTLEMSWVPMVRHCHLESNQY